MFCSCFSSLICVFLCIERVRDGLSSLELPHLVRARTSLHPATPRVQGSIQHWRHLSRPPRPELRRFSPSSRVLGLPSPRTPSHFHLRHYPPLVYPPNTSSTPDDQISRPPFANLRQAPRKRARRLHESTTPRARPPPRLRPLSSPLAWRWSSHQGSHLRGG